METLKICTVHMTDGGFPLNDEVTFTLFIFLFIYKLQQKISFQNQNVDVRVMVTEGTVVLCDYLHIQHVPLVPQLKGIH